MKKTERQIVSEIKKEILIHLMDNSYTGYISEYNENEEDEEVKRNKKIKEDGENYLKEIDNEKKNELFQRKTEINENIELEEINTIEELEKIFSKFKVKRLFAINIRGYANEMMLKIDKENKKENKKEKNQTKPQIKTQKRGPIMTQ